MVSRRFVLCVLAPAALAAFGPAHAQPVRACPEGQAVNSLHPNGTPVQCIPVPPPVDTSGLMQAIVQESAERKNADAEIRASINEASIVGRYTYSGVQMCLNSSRNFNPDLSPVMPPLFTPPPPPLPGQPPPPPLVVPTTFVSQSSAQVTGFRTFRADGTGTLELSAINLNYPGIVYTNFGVVSAQVSNGPPGASTNTRSGTFTWEIVDGKLSIDDSDDASGTITSGGSRVNWITTIRNAPRQVGVLGKDLKTITLINESPSVEISVLTSPPGEPPQVLETPRICQRHRVLTKVSQ